MVTFTLVWLRLELRRHGRSLVVLVLLVAFATCAVLVAVAGARRGDTAEQRLRERTAPADLVVLPNDPAFDYATLRAIPGVEAVGTFVNTEVAVEGLPAAQRPVYLVPAGDEVMRTVERPVVLDGRLADPDRVDEAVVTPNFVASYDLGVGDTVTLLLHTPEGMDAAVSGDAHVRPAGPRVRARIVGVVRSMWFSDSPGYQGGLVTSPALFARYGPNLTGVRESVQTAAFVRLAGGATAVPAFTSAMTEATKRSDIDVWNLGESTPLIQKTTDFEAGGLLAFALAALLAAVVLVGQSLARHAGTAVDDLRVLRGLGLPPRHAVLAGSAAPTVAAAAGGAVGVAVAFAASAAMPIGAAAALEPAPGVDADWLVLGVGWGCAVLLVTAGTATALLIALRRRGQVASGRRSAVALAAARAGLPVPVVVGTRFALETGRGRAAVPVRPALLAAITGVLGIVAVSTFSAGVADATTNMKRFGLTYGLETRLGEDGQDMAPAAGVIGAVAADPDVVGLNDARVGVAESGTRTVRLYTYDPVGAPIDVVLSAGRMPAAASEIVLGPHTASVLGAGIGSTTKLTGTKGPRRVTVTGIGFVPAGERNFYFDGGWLTPAGYAEMFDGFESHQLQIALRDGADEASVTTRLERATAPLVEDGGPAFEPPMPPGEIAQVRGVRNLPLVLGLFLAALGVGAIGHALSTAVRRRRRDVAVLRALGMTGGQCRAVVAVQATVLTLVGLVFGVPLGLALGRTVWRLVADYTPLAYHPPTALWALLAVGPAALLVANLLAALPARRAGRLPVGDVLRAE